MEVLYLSHDGLGSGICPPTLGGALVMLVLMVKSLGVILEVSLLVAVTVG